jgi:hypothetical protein
LPAVITSRPRSMAKMVFAIFLVLFMAISFSRWTPEG